MTHEQEYLETPEMKRQRLFQQIENATFGDESPFTPTQGQNGCEVVVLGDTKHNIATIIRHENLLNKGEAIGISYMHVGRNPKSGDPEATHVAHGAIYATGDVMTAYKKAGENIQERAERVMITEIVFQRAYKDITEESLTPITLGPRTA